MKVLDLAKELKTTADDVLLTLKSLRLKAKGEDQELNDVVLSILRREYSRPDKKRAAPLPPPPPAVAPAAPVEPVIAEEKPAVKTRKKKAEDLPAEKGGSSAEEKPKRKTVKAKTTEAVKTPKAKKPAKEKIETEIAPVNEILVQPVAKTAAVMPAEPVKSVEPVIAAAAASPSAAEKKPKSKISREPVITLKPLARKRRKSGRDEDGPRSLSPADTGAPVSSSADAAASAMGIAAGEVGAPDERVLQEIQIDLPITVKELSTRIQQKPSAILTSLMKMGLLAHINQSLGEEIVNKLLYEFGFSLARVRTQEEQLIDQHHTEDETPELLKPRGPVVTLMGHVDHGKTTLLDKIRKSRVADTEHGGITQHMRAYSVLTPKGRITFLDTPGHEAFTSMRARGAHITDIIILVVAADEGLMPQTLEAIDHARAAQVPMVVALTKIDKRNIDLDRVKKQLGTVDLLPEDWGGKTVAVPVSALTGEGIDTLLDMVLLEAELLELKANPDKLASGIVVEAHMDAGKGVVATLIIQGGTLKEGDYIVAGPHYGKVKAMFDDWMKNVKRAGPCIPVEVIGLPEVPNAGEMFYAVEDERKAREISGQRMEKVKLKKLQSTQRLTLEDLYARTQDGQAKELNIIIKSDVQGSLEALRDSLAKIPSDKIRLKFIHLGVGDVNTSDVVLALASKAIIIAFHVGIDTRAKQEMENDPVDVRQYRIIYDAVNEIRAALEGMLDAKKIKRFIGRVEIREVFKLTKHGIVAGCYVQKGKITRKVSADVIRNGEIVFSGHISSLKRFKDDVREVTEGMECGITVSNFTGYEKSDLIEAYEVDSIAQKL
ncbi:MAG: translation initiation factor IF-2 [Candidatus Omnitrophica bacterium]|nr:translation initiation factor IF-2 [Candidatus Omnitrophota bacterium]